MKYFIVTGASRGIGEVLSQKLLVENHHLICISRHQNSPLITTANTENIPLDYLEFDLNNVHEIDDLMKTIFGKIDELKAESIYLINNAAVVSRVENFIQAKAR
ncbi:SDR family NAD(P)-dependent oxidoreductase [Paenibacillus sp. CAU 1782]